MPPPPHPHGPMDAPAHHPAPPSSSTDSDPPHPLKHLVTGVRGGRKPRRRRHSAPIRRGLLARPPPGPVRTDAVLTRRPGRCDAPPMAATRPHPARRPHVAPCRVPRVPGSKWEGKGQPVDDGRIVRARESQEFPHGVRHHRDDGAADLPGARATWHARPRAADAHAAARPRPGATHSAGPDAAAGARTGTRADAPAGPGVTGAAPAGLAPRAARGGNPGRHRRARSRPALAPGDCRAPAPASVPPRSAGAPPGGAMWRPPCESRRSLDELRRQRAEIIRFLGQLAV